MAGQRGADLGLAPPGAGRRVKAAPGGVEGDVAGREVGVGALGREGQAVELPGEAAAVGIVDVDDRRVRPISKSSRLARK